MSGEDPKIVARDERKKPEVEKLLRQFIGDGAKGNTPAYKRGHEFAFGKDAAFKARVNALMETHGYSFDDAFLIAESEDKNDNPPLCRRCDAVVDEEGKLCKVCDGTVLGETR